MGKKKTGKTQEEVRLENYALELMEIQTETSLAEAVQASSEFIETTELFHAVKDELWELNGRLWKPGFVHKLLMMSDPEYIQLQENVNIARENMSKPNALGKKHPPAPGSAVSAQWEHLDGIRQAYLEEKTNLHNASIEVKITELKEQYPEIMELIEDSDECYNS